jgi:serine/threonine protein kinase
LARNADRGWYVADNYGRWIVKGTISEGGQARVYLVEDSTGDLPGQYALKRLKNVKRMDLFEREVGTARRLQHPNILDVKDFDLTGPRPYYVAEYCERGSLEKSGAGPFNGNISKSVQILIPIVTALHAAHEAGIVHRDVKPANILLRADDTPVLGDFGICHVEGDQRVTLSDEAMGSTNYIAPEMESGHQGSVTGVADVYALGKVMYWMLSGGRTGRSTAGSQSMIASKCLPLGSRQTLRAPSPLVSGF